MLEFLKNYVLEFLKNDIVVNWIAPIITSLVVIIITTTAVKFFRNKKDEKTVEDANKRYVETVMPFIIQKINCIPSFFTDVRNVIVNESRLKEKYVYTEIELRNKIIVSISESEYIDEKNKEELIEFTYEQFKGIEHDPQKEMKNKGKEEKDTLWNKVSLLINSPIILFVVSQILTLLVYAFSPADVKPEDNLLIAMPLLLSLVSICLIVLQIIDKIFRSNVTNKKNDYYDLYSFHYDDFKNLYFKINNTKRKKNK